jgi:hypothetical protein
VEGCAPASRAELVISFHPNGSLHVFDDSTQSEAFSLDGPQGLLVV